MARVPRSENTKADPESESGKPADGMEVCETGGLVSQREVKV